RLSRIFKDVGRNDEALKYAERCRELSYATSNEWTYASALTVIAEIEDERGHPQQAERLYREALDAFKIEAGRNLLGSGIQVALGRLLTRQGSFDAAAIELHDALRRTQGDSVSMVNESAANEALAELCERRGELASAIAHLRKARTLREEI